MFYGLMGLLCLILDIYALYLILTGSGDTAKKLLWALVVVILTPLGAILYLLLGRAA